MKKIVLLFMLVTFITLTSCSKNPSVDGVEYTKFLNLLTDSGFQYTEGELDDSSFLSVSRKPILIGDGIISIYEYESNEEMEKDSGYIGQDGYSISCPGKSVDIDWVSRPHFFKKGTLIVNYVGEDEQILKFLNENYGAQFAGYGYSNQ